MKANKPPSILEFYERYFQGEKEEGLPEYLIDAIKAAEAGKNIVLLPQLRYSRNKSIYQSLLIGCHLLAGKSVMLAHYHGGRNNKDTVINDITKYFGVVPRIIDKTKDSTTLVFRCFEHDSLLKKKLNHPSDLIIVDDPFGDDDMIDVTTNDSAKRELRNKWCTDVFFKNRKIDEDES